MEEFITQAAADIEQPQPQMYTQPMKRRGISDYKDIKICIAVGGRDVTVRTMKAPQNRQEKRQGTSHCRAVSPQDWRTSRTVPGARERTRATQRMGRTIGCEPNQYRLIPRCQSEEFYCNCQVRGRQKRKLVGFHCDTEQFGVGKFTTRQIESLHDT